MDDDYKDRIRAAVVSHIFEMTGEPLTAEDVIARFLVYASVMTREYGITEADSAELLDFARKHEIVSSKRVDPETLKIPKGN